MAHLSEQLPLADQVRLTAGQDMWSSVALPDQGLASIRMADGPMGLTGGRVDERDVALLTPCGTCLGASWDHDLVYRIGQLIGDEARRVGVQAVLGPNLNLPRSPLAGRAFELFSEDPQLTAELGSQWIAGVQQRGVAAVAKHVVCNDSETDRRSMNSVVDERTVREVYLWPFEHAARQGVWAMLTAYNRLNGTPCAEQTQVLRHWLKEELSWDGLVMSDWFGTGNGLRSLAAGLDLEMPGPARHLGVTLEASVRDGLIAPQQLGEAVDRLQRLAARVSANAPAGTGQAPLELLEEAAAAGFVLLKNEQVLPLPPGNGRSLAVIGPNATVPCYQGGTFAKVALDPDTPLVLHSLTEHLEPLGWQVETALGVQPEYRLPPLTAFDLRTAQGEPGLDVSFFDFPASAQPAHQEVRRTTSMIWFKDMPGVGNLLTLKGLARIEASTSFVPPHSGVYRFCLGGTGEATLLLDSQPCLEYNGAAVSGDIMGKLMQCDHASVERYLEAGRAVSLKFHMTLGASLAHGLWFGCEPPRHATLLDEAVALARRVEQVVLVVGETPDAGLESVDRDTTHLPAAQIELIERVCAANPNTVVVVNAAHAIDTACLDRAGAVLMAWYPGQQFGPALAKVLSGEREPGGRLPVTFAAHEADYPAWSLRPDRQGNLPYNEGPMIGYRGFAANGNTPKYALGHGLGYGRFTYDNLRIDGENIDALWITVNVRNIAARASKEVIQVYLQGPGPQGYLRLAAFTSVKLLPGEAIDVRLALPRRAMETWRDGRWCVLDGEHALQVGRSVADMRLQGRFFMCPEGGVKLL
ncbi:glycoside hydrolase family 3 protein [Pseudomonas putida]